MALPVAGTVQERPVPAMPSSSGTSSGASSGVWPGETGQFARPDWFTPPAQEPPGTSESPPAAESRTGRAPRPEPLWRRVLRRVVNTVLGLALIAAAVSLQPLILDADDLDAPITSSGGHGDTVRTAFFDARVEGVEIAGALQQKDRPRVQAMSGQVFVVVKLAAMASTRALRLKTARLVTADGLKFHTTERLDAGASLGDKWVQPRWWSSGLYVFEVPPSALPGARLVVAEETPLLFGDQYLPEASIDLGLDAAKARTARDVYQVPRT
ncbi:hypothetical protein AB0K60_31460 [Thermopolyspora sp. NPDC052614]|uniref:hypothetical protein n=1 Tax=Thermopolyspora sp. NPDC052614 TaxID=3155682 RepID=UPI00342D6042